MRLPSTSTPNPNFAEYSGAHRGWTRRVLCSWLISFERDWRTQCRFDEIFVTATKRNPSSLIGGEQDHKQPPYRFVRDTDRKEDTLQMMAFWTLTLQWMVV